jgi:hypothetical protein
MFRIIVKGGDGASQIKGAGYGNISEYLFQKMQEPSDSVQEEDESLKGVIEGLEYLLEKFSHKEEDSFPKYVSLKIKDGVYCSLDYQSLLMGVECNTFTKEPFTVYKVDNKEEFEYIKSLGYFVEEI